MAKCKRLTTEEADALYMLGVELEWNLGSEWVKDTYVAGACPPADDNSKGLKWRVRIDG
jgi:hypothetical protein